MSSWRAVAAFISAFPVVALQAAPAPTPRLPAAVRRHVKDINYWCSRVGGVPPKSSRFVQIVELTGDDIPDYLIDISHYNCRKRVSFMYGGHNGEPISIFVGLPHHVARLAYDDYSHGVELTTRGGRSRVWLTVGALACGQPPKPGLVFAAWWFCSRPLQWNGRTKKFEFGPLSQVRNITRGGSR